MAIVPQELPAVSATATTEMTYAEAVRDALTLEMRRDPAVFMLGEDIGIYGGAFAVTRGMYEEFGAERVRDTPIAEAAIAGAAIGAALTGMRPVAEIQFSDFMSLTMDQLVNQGAKIRFMFGGKATVPMVIRAPLGSGTGAAAQHSQSLEAWLAHVPGLKVVMPATPADAKGLLIASIRDDNPVVFLEHKLLYRQKGPVPTGDYVIPLGQSHVKRAGTDATVVALSIMVPRALAAAERLAQEGIEVEVIDPRSLRPFDEAPIIASVQKTGKLLIVHEAVMMGGFGGEIAARVSGSEAFHSLTAPIVRLAGAEVPIPFNPILERAAVPQEDDIVAALRHLVRDAHQPRVHPAPQAATNHQPPTETQPSPATDQQPSAMTESAQTAPPAAAPQIAEPQTTTRTVMMPKLGMTMTEGIIVTWSVAVGDVVVKDTLLGEVETDKVTLEIESPAAGRVVQILANPGDAIAVGAPILVLATEGEPVATGQTTPPAPASTPSAPVATASDAQSNGNGNGHQPEPSGTPLARRIAAQHGISLAEVAPPGGAVRAPDVLAYIATRDTGTPHAAPEATPAPAPNGATAPNVDTTDKLSDLSSMRRVIAERTTQSFTTTPHIYLDTEVDMWRVEAWHAATADAPSVTAVMIRAVALALRAHPEVNAGYVAASGGKAAQIRQFGEVNIGVAVALPDGLIVPVLRRADTRSVRDMGRELARLASAARAGRLGPDDVTGGSFSVSNLGMLGIDTFHAVINAPQAAILAVGRVTRRPVTIADGAGGETIGIRPLLKLSLSADHRVIDGAMGARFLATLRGLLEDPQSVVADPGTDATHKGVPS